MACVVKDALERIDAGDTKADDRCVIKDVLATTDDGEVTGEATVGSPATVGTSVWFELSVAPGVEHPTPPPLLPTAACV